MEWLIYLMLGAFAGLLAGLFGVGGGAVIVPVLIVTFGLLEFAPQSTVHIAVGTSFATIVVTATSSLLAHQKHGNIDWRLWRALTPGLLGGVVLGSLLAVRLDGAQLKLGVGIFFMLIAVQMFFSLQPGATFRRQPGLVLQGVAGSGIGAVSAFFGIGGGSLTVPWLTLTGEKALTAVATSAACGLPIAIGGALSYALMGRAVDEQSVWLTGFVYWPAFVGIALASVPLARLGARLASQLPDAGLKKLFALLLFGVSLHILTMR